jgi:hypothetical protein
MCLIWMLACLGAHAAVGCADEAQTPGPGASVAELQSGAEPVAESRWPMLLSAQYTFVRQNQSSLTSPYAGPLSLDPEGDTQNSHTIGAYLGWALTGRMQLYLDTEKFMGAGVSGASGLGGLTNGDVVRAGANNLPKRFYVARLYARYVFPLSGETATIERAQDQIPGTQPARRLEFKAGLLAVNDDFDLNRYANSTRTQFMNWSFWNNVAWDFAADTRGFTRGVMLAYVSPTWSLRYGLYQMPIAANDQQLESSWRTAHAQNLELTLSGFSHGTVLRVLAFSNIARMGIYNDAIAAAQATGTTPNIVAQDQDGRRKYGFGVNAEQPLADDGDTGLFVRAGWNDGHTESFAFTEVDHTFTFGGQLAGSRWLRSQDRVGLALAINGLSEPHRNYLAAGGSGFLLGDGRLNYGTEQILESYYCFQFGHYVQLSPDVQFIVNPGFNRDRGPVHFWALRLHLQY